MPLRDDHGDGNENGKRATELDQQNDNFARAFHAFLYTSLPSLHDYDVEMPNFAFSGELEHKATTSFFFFWSSIQSFRIQLWKNWPAFDELNEMG